ncbi:MAG TPA: hypothetical protein VFG59_18390 [Anaeromyxobacter sp.]|nr:hypothetical protein [Anaeromyxobacter sp.]
MKRLLALTLAVVPLVARAQAFTLRPPSPGDSITSMERLTEQAEERERAAAAAHPEDLDLQQVFVYPERPGQNQVAWYGFRWRFVDIPPLGGGPGGIRLYYYASEEAQARRALPAIESAYARLVEVFHYNPTHRIPYILYATQREFQTQNVFQVTESVLGVTSPEDLKMTVPYFGDHSRFIEVSTHEMVHQFHIQKMEDQAGRGGTSAIDILPLWFTEGIAEYYSKGGIDVETDLFLRDLVWNPDPRHHYQVVPFGDDELHGYIPTYKLGQARIAFLAEEYGPDSIQAFIERAGTGTSAGGMDRGFPGLVERVLNEPIDQVDARWRAWLKRRYYAAYLGTRQDLPGVHEVRKLPSEPEAFTASPSGQVVLYRGLDRERGRARLVLFDPRSPGSAEEVAADDRPGMESLHPIDYGVVALGEKVLAFSAQDGIGDRLYVQTYRHRPVKAGKPARLWLGKQRALEVRPPEGDRFITIADPTLSPDETEVAFVGVAADGQQDLYLAPLDRPSRARRLTNDYFAKKDLAWGADGIVYASDATEHGHLNLFRIDPATGVRTRLTTGAATDRYPAPQPDGSVLFTSDAGGKPDVWELRDSRIRRLTDFSTGLHGPRRGASGQGILASTFHGGRFRLVQVADIALLDEPWREMAPPAGEPLPIPEADFPAPPQEYRPLAVRNWRPDAGFVYGGGSSGGIAGRAAVLFSDYLRDHTLFADVSVYGSFDYTQGVLLYEDRAGRVGLILGAYHFVQQQVDALDPNLAYNQRDFGVVAAVSYPLDRFQRFELELSAGASQRFCLTDFTGAVVLSCGGLQNAGSPYASTADWRRQNGGTNPVLTPALRYGYDSVRYHPTAGPLDGSSLLVEVGGGWLPTREAVHGFARLDAERYFQIVGRSRFWTRLALGASFSPGGRSRLWERSWWLTPEDNLRGYGPGDIAFLIGTHYYVANAELQVPLDPLLHLAIFQYMSGIAGVDFGGVFSSWSARRDASGAVVDPGAWGSRTLTGVLGVNLALGPILFRLHFGHPFNIHGVETPALADHRQWVTNISLRYLFF